MEGAPAACRLHPEAPSVGACARCSGGVCAACALEDRGRLLHKACFRELKLAVLSEAPEPRAEPLPAAAEEEKAAEEAAAPPSVLESPFVLRVLRLSLGGLGGGFLGFAAATVVIALQDPLAVTGAHAERIFQVCAALGLAAGAAGGVLARRTRPVLVFLALAFALSLLAVPAMRAVSGRSAPEARDDSF